MKSSVLTITPAREATSFIAMALALLSVAMLFMTLLLGYAILRFNSPLWPPMAMGRVDMFYPVISSTLIALSSLCYIIFENKLRRQIYRPGHLYKALFFGIGFFASQGLFWAELKANGLYTSAGIFPSIIYGLTWAHGGHMAIALAALIYLILKKRRFKDKQSELLWVQNVGKFWHFLGIIWFILYITVFVF